MKADFTMCFIRRYEVVANIPLVVYNTYVFNKSVDRTIGSRTTDYKRQRFWGGGETRDWLTENSDLYD